MVELARNSPVFWQLAHGLLRLLSEREPRVSRDLEEELLAKLVGAGVSLEGAERSKEVCEALLREAIRRPASAKIGPILDWLAALEGLEGLEGSEGSKGDKKVETRETQETLKDVKESKESKDSKDSKESEESKDSKVSKGPQDSKGPRGGEATFFELAFGVLEALDASRRPEFLDALVLRFPDSMKPLAELLHADPAEVVHRSFHDFPDSPVSLFLERCALLLFPARREAFIRSFLPSLFDLPADLASLAAWSQSHGFFREIGSVGSRLLFREWVSFGGNQRQTDEIRLDFAAPKKDPSFGMGRFIGGNGGADPRRAARLLRLPRRRLLSAAETPARGGNAGHRAAARRGQRALHGARPQNRGIPPGRRAGAGAAAAALSAAGGALGVALSQALQRRVALRSALRQLDRFIQRNSKSVADALPSVVDSLLALVAASPAEWEQAGLRLHELPVARLLSLRVLRRVADFPLATALPLRNRVCDGLRGALDDEQRAVREYAARVRNLWLMIH